MRAYIHSPIYNSVQKVQAYWESFKPPGNTPDNYLQKWLSQAPLFEAISLQNRACITLWDVVSNQFVYAVDKTQVLDNYASKFVEPDGIHFSMSNYPTEHLHATLAMQKVAVGYCIDHPEVVDQIVMNQDCVYNCKGDQIHFIQQIMVVETNVDGHPLLFLSFLYDISHLKKNSSASLVISTPDKQLMWDYNFKTNMLDVVPCFTIQEKRVLQFLGEGKNTKQMAKEMFLSPHTVDTHRRKLLAKTHCIDTTALVTYCRMVGLM